MGEQSLPLGGHALRITETNTGGYVPLCECGWSGNVHLTTTDRLWSGGELVRNQPKALAAALRDHTAHVTDERSRARALLDPKVVAIVRRPGRFSQA